MNSKILFKETQRFKQLWVWILLVGINIFLSILVYFQFIEQTPLGNNPISDLGLILIQLTILLITLFIFILRLETEIREDGVYVKFFPFHLNFKGYKWENIEKCFPRKYKPIWEYGGWGLRGFGKYKAYNVSGNEGLQLKTKDGISLLIGTKKTNEIKKILLNINKLID
jgi:hypothetical protein